MRKYKFTVLEDSAKKCVDWAKKEKAVVLMTIHGYRTKEESLILLDFLWYANSKGVEVTIIPGDKK